LAVAEVMAVLDKRDRLLKAILSDHGSGFKKRWKEWCCERRVEVLLRVLFVRGGKGKVEGCIQGLNLLFVNHLGKFPEWLKGKLCEYRERFNGSCFHWGVKAFPVKLYECSVRNLT
jgi:hypothetical protein